MSCSRYDRTVARTTPLYRRTISSQARGSPPLARGSRSVARGVAPAWARLVLASADLSPAASAFLAVSTQQEHHAARLRRAVLVVLSVLAFVPRGLRSSRLATASAVQRERDAALSSQLTAQADRLRGTDTSVAAQLDLTAYRMRPKTRDLPVPAGIPWPAAARIAPFDEHPHPSDVGAVCVAARALPAALPVTRDRKWLHSQPYLWMTIA